MFIYTISFCLFQCVYGQFGSIFGQPTQTNLTGGPACPQSVSCMPAPWCTRSVDSNGCPKCVCSMGGFSSAFAGRSGEFGMSQSRNLFPAMSSMLGSGMNGFPGFPSFNGQSSFMNPMAAMLHQMQGQMGGPGSGVGFNSLTGPTGIGTGALPNSNQPVPTPKTLCDPAPYTCSLPPPWCQRTVNSDGCVVCYCGQELDKYLHGVQTGTNDQSTIHTTMQSTTELEHKLSTSHAPTQATTTSCLSNFFCTTTCDHGYMTDASGCPLCECISPGSSGIVTTKVPAVHITTTTPIVTTGTSGGTILCPGIFDCTLMCMSGYQIDAQGCPVCKCLQGS